MISGPPSWYGKEGQTCVNFEELNVTFSKPDSLGNSTDEIGGQFPVFLFTHYG